MKRKRKKKGEGEREGGREKQRVRAFSKQQACSFATIRYWLLPRGLKKKPRMPGHEICLCLAEAGIQIRYRQLQKVEIGLLRPSPCSTLCLVFKSNRLSLTPLGSAVFFLIPFPFEPKTYCSNHRVAPKKIKIKIKNPFIVISHKGAPC